jgi:hypothetical protein
MFSGLLPQRQTQGVYEKRPQQESPPWRWARRKRAFAHPAFRAKFEKSTARKLNFVNELKAIDLLSPPDIFRFSENDLTPTPNQNHYAPVPSL